MKKHSHQKNSDRPSERRSDHPWSVPLSLHQVPETGHRVELHADAGVRGAVAALAGLRDLPRLEAAFDVSRHGQAGLRVAGRVSATVGQVCVVTLEPMESDIDEPIDLVFAPPQQSLAAGGMSAAEIGTAEDAPEPLVAETVDLGAIATEFLILALDPYPRKPGAVFQPPGASADLAAHPFAALAALKDRKERE